MALRDLKLPSTTIETPGGSFDVRGLSYSDLMTLATAHGSQMALLFGKITSGGGMAISEERVKATIANLAPQFTEIVAGAIALAADEYNPEGIAVASKLSFNKQTEALEAIFMNTFQSEAELKKFMETIIRMITGVRVTLDQVRLPLSEAGFGASEGK